jgi:DNA-binding MarR family transcriptional regulator
LLGSLRELARALAIHQSTASNLVGRLESLGLLARNRLRDDQRSVELTLTAEGKRALARAPRPLIGVLQQALLDLPENRLDALQEHLGVLIGTMKIKDTRSRSMPLSDM